MSAVTINDIRTAVFHRLAECFPDIKRYGEEIKQGFQGPCFFVELLAASHTQELGTRYMRTHSFNIHYFPRNNSDLNESNEELHDMAEQLYDALELIEYNDVLYQGVGMNHEIVEGVLHFFVDYSFRVRRIVTELPKMAELKQEGLLK